MKIKGRYIRTFSYLYITLPPLIFLIGYSAPLWAAVFGVIIVLSLWHCLSSPEEDYPDLPIDRTFFAAAALILVMIFLSGIGGHAYQNGDIPFRNRMLSSLVLEKWPLQRSVPINGETQNRAFIYYLGFWMVPAVLGKLFGLRAAFFFLELWAGLGILLTWYHICRYTKRFSFFPLLLFFCFGGLDYIGWLSNGRNYFSGTEHLEWWSKYQYSSFTTQLFWVYNQAIYAWIITLMVLQSKKNRHLVFIWSTGLLSCTLPFAGLLPYLVYRLWTNYKDSQKSLSDNIRELFSFENVLGGGTIGIMSFLFLSGNISAQNLQSSGDTGITASSIAVYLTFIFLEAFVYLLLLWNKRRGGIYYITAAVLALCPLIRVGHGMDFCMRASIPALLVLFLMILEALQPGTKKSLGKLKYGLLAFLICVGSISSMHELTRSLYYSPFMWKTSGFFDPQYIPDNALFVGDNFSGKTEDNLFFVYFAKKT